MPPSAAHREQPMNQEHYHLLAGLLEYPSERWPSLRVDAEAHFSNRATAATENVLAFCRMASEIPLYLLQERYTMTFDLNPVCALEIGHYLFGEDYKRGLFLANLRETEAPYELGQAHQLPDFLPVLLRLLPALDDRELKSSLILECMLPAAGQMVRVLENTEIPYKFLLNAAYHTLLEEEPSYKPRLARPTLAILGAPATTVVCDSMRQGGANTHVR